MKPDTIILASASPRRIELLHMLFSDFEVEPSRAEEAFILPAGLDPEEEPELLASVKAGDIASRHPSSLVIGSDTVVLAEENGTFRVLGKPSTSEEAVSMLQLLSGQRHYVVTGCCLMWGDKVRTFRVKTAVDFYPLTEEEILAYVATGEPMDKAGAYGIQGLGSLLIRGIEGDYYTVMGFPIATLKRELDAFLQE